MASESIGDGGSGSLDGGKNHLQQASCPTIIVKFRDSVELPYLEGAEKYLPSSEAGLWSKLFETQAKPVLRPLITVLTPQEINALTDRARQMDRTYRPVNFLSYFRVECVREGIETFLSEVNSLKSVETAYVSSLVEDPAVNVPPNPLAAAQGYLDPAPLGIDAKYAWNLPGGDGSVPSAPVLQLVDLEKGWALEHVDLPTKTIAPIAGVIVDTSRFHGTQVLGVVCAVDNATGCIGIVPNLGLVNVASYSKTSSDPPDGTLIPDAIFAALSKLVFGDVLLLEVEAKISTSPANSYNLLPIEGTSPTDAIFQAIRLASALGVVVVEAAGNGRADPTIPVRYGINLDTYPNWSAGAQNSGAIMVGSASEIVVNGKHGKMRDSNYGSRIDCYGWGNLVTTTDSVWNPVTGTYTKDGYTGAFNGTSSAAAIVAGAALSVQAMAQSSLGFRLSPVQIKAVLSDRTPGAPGQPSNTGSDDAIGVMPNLAFISQSLLHVAPDVYIRDFVGDVGDPHSGSISVSPDIIVRNVAEANPQGAFGAGSGTENNDALSSDVLTGRDNFVYVRVLNRGGSPASGVSATVYWSPPATLVNPDLWTLIGTTVLPSVPVNFLTVSDAIQWPAVAIPATGHYCFVALVGNKADPAPDPARFRNWADYQEFIRNNNNVTWRNFNVVKPAMMKRLVGHLSYAELPFFATGTPGEELQMRLAIDARLPVGARLLLEGPADFLAGLNGGTYSGEKSLENLSLLPINPYGFHELGQTLFSAASRTSLRLLLHIPEKFQSNIYQLRVSQFFEEFEIGRITWRFMGGGDPDITPKGAG